MPNIESNCFPDSYPKHLLDCIIADGANKNTFEPVYRISDTGLCNRDAFLCTAIQNQVYALDNRDSYLAQKEANCDVDIWSTSCWQNKSSAKRILTLKEKHGHSPCILVGTILPETGYSIVTSDRRSARENKSIKRKYHVDWWIFKNIDVSVYFTIMEVN